MKLKTMLLGGLLLIPFFSCENREEFNIVQVESELVANFEVISESEVSPGLKSMVYKSSYLFTGTCVFCLAQNNELGKPLCSVQNIKPCAGSKLVIANVGPDANILSMKLKWGFKNKNESGFEMQDDIDLTLLSATQKNGNIELNLSDVINPLVNCIDCNPACLYRFEISGRSDFSLPSQVRLTIPVSAEKKVYNVQFSLF